MRFSKLSVYVPVVSFVLGWMMLAFIYGVTVGVYKVLPYEALMRAKQAMESLIEIVSPSEKYIFAPKGDGVTILAENRVFNGLTFFAGYRAGGYQGLLIDMHGKTLHEWKVTFSQVWEKPVHIIKKADDGRITWHGTYLFPNGDLLVNFEDGNFPYGGGLVKLDKDSNIIWSLARNTHHDIDVLPDGAIYVAAHNYRPDGLSGVKSLKPPYYEDVVLKVSPDGKVISEISVIEALLNSPYQGLLVPMHTLEGKLYSLDPTHLNDIELVTGTIAEEFPLFKEGELLVSLRNINSLVLIDPSTRSARWALTGAFVHQHDPDFSPDGTIVLYDNKGGTVENGKTQLIAIEPASQQITWRYTGSREKPFFSGTRGKQQLLPNGNILIIEPSTGRIFEITNDGDVVWEYYNTFPAESGENLIVAGQISEAMRYPIESLSFLKEKEQNER